MEDATLRLLHVLVLVYWLGGDLGSFASSFVISDPKAAPAARLAMAKLLGHLDMAPRSALILAAPTGLALAAHTGWIAAPGWVVGAVWALSLGWLGLVWFLHLRHGAAPLWRTLDLAIRWGAIAVLLGAALLVAEAPSFLRLKLALLAGAILAGLAIRAALKPFGPGLAALARGQANAESEAAIGNALNRARPAVLAIWALLAAAAWLGLAKPL